MSNFAEDKILKYIEQLMAIDSPSGFTNNAVEYLENFAKKFNVDYEITNKGNLNIIFKVNDNKEYTQYCSHIDTLGLMVRSINSDGSLRLTTIGSPIVSSLYGEYVKIYTRTGKCYTGTLLVDSPSMHVFPYHDKKVDIDNLILKIDEDVFSKSDVIELGITTGAFVCFDPKFKITNNFIKSRFLDDKAVAGLFLEVIEEIVIQEISLKENTIFSFSTYEEQGHGMSYVCENVTKIYPIDMGCVGKDLSGSEYKVSICAKDSSGPYDYELTNELIEISQKLNLDYAIDIYPRYGSDGSAAMRAGNDLKVALFGPGVSASHGMERTNIKSLFNTYSLLKELLTK